jgi:hypothetical protein
MIIFLIVNCEVINFNPKSEKDRCKLTFAYRVNVSEEEKKKKEYPLFLYLMYDNYRYCVQSAEELPLPKFQE